MAGVTFTIASSGQVVGQVISTGSPDPVCLEGLAPGTYQIAQIVPARLEMTTAANTTLDVSGSSSFGVEFGSRLRPAGASDGQAVASNPEPTPADAVPTAQPAPAEGSSMSVMAISGLAVMLLAVIMLGVLIFLVLRKQTK